MSRTGTFTLFFSVVCVSAIRCLFRLFIRLFAFGSWRVNSPLGRYDCLGTLSLLLEMIPVRSLLSSSNIYSLLCLTGVLFLYFGVKFLASLPLVTFCWVNIVRHFSIIRFSEVSDSGVFVCSSRSCCGVLLTSAISISLSCFSRAFSSASCFFLFLNSSNNLKA